MKEKMKNWPAGEGCRDCPFHGPDDDDCPGTMRQWFLCSEPWGNNPGGKKSKNECIREYELESELTGTV